MYDAHTGVAKGLIKQIAISGHDIKTIADLLKVLHRMKGTFVIELLSDERLPKLHYTQMPKGVKKFH